MSTIAGHHFETTNTGRRCIAYSSEKGGTCEARWVHVRTCRQADIEVTRGIAHHGTPTRLEFAEIRAEVEREEAAIWEAVIDAASAGSR